MRFDIFSRYELDVEGRDDRWVVYQLGEGARRENPSVFIPSHVPEEEVARFLEDLLHEEGHPGGAVRRVR